jgi:hypothetical protein
VIIPGHGALADPAALRVANEMLVSVRDRVKGAIARGVGLEELIASDPLADLNEAWGGGFIDPKRMLTIVYTDLAR